MSESLKKQTIKNVSYNAIAKVITFGFQGLANIVLSQNLGASDYGIVGFAMIFVNFLGRFNDLGIQTAVVQRKDLDEQTLYTAYTTKTVLGVAMYLATFFIAGIAPYFFDNHIVVTVIRLVSLNFVINSFAFLPRVMLTRELNFKKISISEVCVSLTSSAVAVSMALSGFKYWSIVTATLASNLVGVSVVNRFRPVRIKLSFDKAIAKELIRFGGNLFIAGMTAFIVFNADNFVVGSVAGSAALGYYALAFNWGSLICMVLGDVVHSVLFPTFTKMQGDADRIKTAYLQILEIVGFVAVLVNLTLFLGAESFLYYVLGKGSDKWLPALTTFRIMCCYGIVRAMLEPIGSVIMAIGKTKLLLKANLVAAAIELLLLYPVIVFFGIEGAGILITVAYLSQYLIYWPAINNDICLTFKQLLVSVLPSLVPLLIVVSIYCLLFSYLTALHLLLFTPVGIVSFIVLSGLFSNWKLFYQVKILLQQRNNSSLPI